MIEAKFYFEPLRKFKKSKEYEFLSQLLLHKKFKKFAPNYEKCSPNNLKHSKKLGN